MKKALFIFVFVLTSFNFCLSQEWFTSFDVAKRLAIVQNKMLFVMWEDAMNYQYPVLTDNDNGDSTVADLFEDEYVNKLIWDYFVPVKISESKYVELSNQIRKQEGLNILISLQMTVLKLWI